MSRGFDTLAIHSPKHKKGNAGHITPIYATSSFSFEDSEQAKILFSEGRGSGFTYGRFGNPNTEEVEQKIAFLETYGLKDLKVSAILHSSGQAAHSTMFLSNLQPGDSLIASFPNYGGTQELMTKVLTQAGINIVESDFLNLQGVEKQLTGNKSIKWMHIETPSNPITLSYDIEELTKLAHKHNVQVSVDSTFATPYLQQPFKYGVDYVVHSTTKYLNGHGNAVGGILISRHVKFMEEKCLKWQRILGGCPSAFDAFLLNNGLKTLSLRMERHCLNAQRVAEYLETHPAVGRVYYLGLKSHPSYQIAKKQMKHPGGMLSFELKGGFEAGKTFQDRLRLCTRAVSLGNVDTLITHPASTTHIGVSREIRIKYGLTDGLIRMSVGIENYQDIIADLEQALGPLPKL